MTRFITCLLLVLALCAGPALCMGGLFQHACDCGAGGELECQHEDSCSDDPCASVVPRPGQSERAGLELPWPSALATRTPGCAADRARTSSPTRAPRPPDRSHLPYAQSDRPLLL